MAAVEEAEAPKKASLRTVVAASAAGTTFEWYDFFVFGSLTQVISKTFFSGLPETAGYIAALALFGAGFAFRPLGALVFGRIGDRVGRKGAFLFTVVLMGGATVAIGLLPSYAQLGQPDHPRLSRIQLRALLHRQPPRGLWRHALRAAGQCRASGSPLPA